MQLRILGKASVGDLARALGKRPEAVHYHVRGLVKANLAKEFERRPGVKKPEVIYAPLDKELRLPKSQGNSAISALVRKSVAAGFRQTVRGYLEASRKAERGELDSSYMHVIRLNARLAPADAKEFIRQIESLVRFADERRTEAGEQLVWSSVVFPK